jgi:bacterioferritin (cytochrome b1)
VIPLEDKQLISELNRILTLEHGHLGMYRDFIDHEEKEIRRTFRRFSEIEAEHVEKVKSILYNLGAKPSLVVEGGDIIGSLFGFTINKAASIRDIIKIYSAIEKKSHEGYAAFVSKIEQDADNRNRFLAEIVSSNMLESHLMHLWLEDKLKTM